MSSRWLRLSEPDLTGNEANYLQECVATNWVSSGGPFVGEFEKKFASYLGHGTAVAAMNGTAALHAALLAVGVKAGDRVIVPSLTFIATVNPVRYLGAEPVFVDSDPQSWGPDPGSIIAAINDPAARPAAVVTVHLYGQPARATDAVARAAAARGIPLIEDATEALGSLVGGKPVGTFGALGCFSFNGNKLITTGGGGMVWSADPKLADRVRYLTTQARDESVEYIHHEVGYNYRMTNLQAALGLAQLERIDDFIARKRNLAALYRAALAGLDGLTLPSEPAGTRNCEWMFSVLVDQAVHPGGREGLMTHLNQQMIEARPFFQPVHLQRPYAAWTKKLPVAEQLYAQGVNLPSNIGMSESDAARVIEAIRAWAR